MSYFISTTGSICIETSDRTPFPLEEMGIQNWFANKISATTLRDVLEEWEPMIFHGEG